MKILLLLVYMLIISVTWEMEAEGELGQLSKSLFQNKIRKGLWLYLSGRSFA
jgi:hypothetical protein